MKKRHLLSSLIITTILGTTLSLPAVASEKQYDTLDKVELAPNVGLTSNDQTKEAIDYIKKYVDSSYELAKKEREAEILRRKSEKDKRNSISENFQWQSTYAEAGLAKIDSQQKNDTVKKWARDVYKYGTSPEGKNSEDIVTEVLINPETADQKLDSYTQMERSGAQKKEDLERSKEREKESMSLEKEAIKSKNKAEQTAIESVTTTQESKDRTQELSTNTILQEQQYKDASVQFNTVSLDKNNQSDLTLSQRAINQAIVDKWNEYLTTLDNAQVDIPTLKELEDKNFLENNKKDFVAYLDLNGNPTPKVVALAKSPSTYVLPKETIEQVSNQLRETGQKYDKQGDGKDNKWSCSAFVSQSYGQDRNVSLKDMWDSSGQVESLDKLPGDTVFIGSSESGLYHAGTYIGGGMIIASSMPGKSVGVENSGANYFGVKRSTKAPTQNQAKAPEKTDESLNWECGGVVGGATEGEWVVPVTDGTYDFGAKFGKEDEKRWGKKEKTSPGLEFILTDKKQEEKTDDSQSKEPKTEKDSKSKDQEEKPKDSLQKGIVRASGDGIVKVENNNKKWGNLVTISHADDIKTSYAYLDKVTVSNGDKVSKGDAIGTVGTVIDDKEKKNKSLMFMMEKEGKQVDPEPFLFPSSAVTYSGNFNTIPNNFSTDYDNGKLPENMLCPILDNGQKLRCESIASFVALNSAYKNTFGSDICVTDSYRSYEAQVDVKRRKPGLAAQPGTSNHGWGLALDLCGGIQTFGTPQHEWMVKNAKNFGWFLPPWAQANGSKPEAWHWESVLSTKK